jgi:hypothetical protein
LASLQQADPQFSPKAIQQEPPAAIQANTELHREIQDVRNHTVIKRIPLLGAVPAAGVGTISGRAGRST